MMLDRRRTSWSEIPFSTEIAKKSPEKIFRQLNGSPLKKKQLVTVTVDVTFEERGQLVVKPGEITPSDAKWVRPELNLSQLQCRGLE